MADHFFGMILAGGSGTRLWPLSRDNLPKQALSLGGNNLSLLQGAFARLSRVVSPQRILTVTGRNHETLILSQIQRVCADYPPGNLLAEPEGRDSAPAVYWGALRIEALDPDAVVALMWSDQLIRREDAMEKALRQGFLAMENGGLAVIGVPADRPATQLGYIRCGEKLGDGTYAAEEFIEKPDLATAEQLVAAGDCLWNPGVFVFKVRTLLQEYRRLAPQLVDAFQREGEALPDNDWRDPGLMTRIYGHLAKDSIDYLVLEKTDKLSLIPADLDWSDLGTWDELYLQAVKDDQGNALEGNVVAWNTRNSYVRGGKRLITTLGVDNLLVIDTDDALLVCDLTRVQEIKELVAHLKANGFAEAESFGENVRPWGSYTVLAEGKGFKVKVLTVNPGQKLSLQLHNHREEHWVVVEGRVFLTRDDEVREYSTEDYFHIPLGAKHRIDNRSQGMVRIIEIQQGDYLGEDDIVRFEDDYGRM